MSKTPTGLWSLPLSPESTKHFESNPIPLNTGAPPFPVHASVRSAIIKSVEEAKEKLSYPPTRGIKDLIEKVAQDYGCAEEGVVITYGASQALYNILTTIPCGDDVLIPAPFWFAFPHIVAQGRGQLKIIQTSAEDQFKLTPQLLAQSITWRSRILILTNPNNPTGAIYTREELGALVKVLVNHPRLLVLSDEVYNLLPVDGQTCPSIGGWPEIADRVLRVNSLSKNYAMSGLRVGFLAAHPSWADICLQKENYATSGVNEFIQRGALAALNAMREIIRPIVEALKVRRAKAVELLKTIPHTSFITPEAAYFFFWEVGHYIGCRTEKGTLIKSDVDLVDYLLRDANVATVPGTWCGTPGHLRITYALAEDTFAQAINQIGESLQKLRRQD